MSFGQWIRFGLMFLLALPMFLIGAATFIGGVKSLKIGQVLIGVFMMAGAIAFAMAGWEGEPISGAFKI